MPGSQHSPSHTPARARWRVVLLLAFAATLLAACSETIAPPGAEPTDSPTLAGAIQHHEELELFGQLVERAQMDGMLASEGPFTVFAPTAEAFGQFLRDRDLTIGELLDDPELADLLRYSVIDGELPAAELVREERRETLEGTTLRIDAVPGGVKLNARVNVVAADIEASNGVIHVIDSVLEPPASILDVASETRELSTLVTAVTEAGLGEALAQSGLTVFAPTNDAFSVLLDELGISLEELLASPDLVSILTYHVLGDEESSFELVNRSSVGTLNGAGITIEVDGDGLLLNGRVRVATADVVASNGIVHVIDAVLRPPEPSLVETVTSDDRFTILEAALAEVGLVSALEGSGPFTVFGPTDDAFQDLADLYSVPVEDLLVLPFLEDVLLYHVAPGEFTASDLEGIHQVETLLEGESIDVSQDHGALRLNVGTSVVEADIEAQNGVLHAIDSVLLPN